MTPKEQGLAYKMLVKLGKNIQKVGTVRLYTSEQEHALQNMADCMNTLEILLRPDEFKEPGFTMSPSIRGPKKKWGLF